MTDTGWQRSTQRALEASNEPSCAHAQDEGVISPASASEREMPAPARISLLYESRDGRFCLFEDANGHISAVRSARLA